MYMLLYYVYIVLNVYIYAIIIRGKREKRRWIGKRVERIGNEERE